jgi:hypothetical protein
VSVSQGPCAYIGLDNRTLRTVIRTGRPGQGSDNSQRGCVRVFVFPDPDDGPSGPVEQGVCFTIAFDVLPKLLRPPCAVIARAGAMLWTAVPEATVDEHHYALRAEGEVRSTPRHPRQRMVDPISVPETVQPSPQLDLRLGVASRLPRHPRRGLRRGRQYRTRTSLRIGRPRLGCCAIHIHDTANFSRRAHYVLRTAAAPRRIEREGLARWRRCGAVGRFRTPYTLAA